MKLNERYPNLIAKITEPVYDVRDLVVVDENYDDVDSDEFDVFEPDEYNFLVYVTERVQDTLGEEAMARLVTRLEAEALFENFFASEPDMYGIKAQMEEEGVAHRIVAIIEEEFMCSNA